MRIPAAVALLPLLLSATPDDKPFPSTDRSIILREEKTTYLVAGRIVIPKGVEISCQKDIYIKATGTAPAVIVVEGSFKAHGVDGREIIFEGVTVEPGPGFDEIQLELCIFRKGGGLATPKDASAEGRILVQHCKFRDSARVDVAMKGESFQFLDSMTSLALKVRGVPGKDGENRLKAVVRGSNTYGMEALGVADLTVRLCGLGSDPLLFRDCAVLQFDGNKVEGKNLRFEQTRAGGFARTQVMKCDLYARTITLRAPADPNRDDVVVLDKCWFEGLTDQKSIEERIRDSADDPANNVRAKIQNPQERPLELAGRLIR